MTCAGYCYLDDTVTQFTYVPWKVDILDFSDLNSSSQRRQVFSRHLQTDVSRLTS